MSSNGSRRGRDWNTESPIKAAPRASPQLWIAQYTERPRLLTRPSHRTVSSPVLSVTLQPKLNKAQSIQIDTSLHCGWPVYAKLNAASPDHPREMS